MKTYEATETPNDKFVHFEHEGYNWMIHIETLKVYHFETGILMKTDLKGNNWRTIKKRFMIKFENVASKRMQQFKRIIKETEVRNHEK